MAQQLQALLALAKDPGSIPSTHVVLTDSGDLTPSLASLGTKHACDSLTNIQAKIPVPKK